MIVLPDQGGVGELIEWKDWVSERRKQVCLELTCFSCPCDVV